MPIAAETEWLEAAKVAAREGAAIRAEEKKQNDLVHKPQHYAKWAIEPITFIMRNDLPFHVGNIVKYAVRAGSKLYEGMDAKQSEITDLEKVRRYAEMRINQLKGAEKL